MFGFAAILILLQEADGFASPGVTNPSSASTTGNDKGNEGPDSCLVDPECKLLTDNARTQSASGKYTEALTLYQLAYQKQPVPWLLVNIGRVLQKQKQYDRALEHYRQFLTTNTGSSELNDKVKEYINQAEAEKQASLSIASAALSEKTEIERPKPMYKQWWPWTILGIAAAAGIGVSVGLYLYSRQPDTDGLPVIRPLN